MLLMRRVGARCCGSARSGGAARGGAPQVCIKRGRGAAFTAEKEGRRPQHSSPLSPGPLTAGTGSTRARPPAWTQHPVSRARAAPNTQFCTHPTRRPLPARGSHSIARRHPDAARRAPPPSPEELVAASRRCRCWRAVARRSSRGPAAPMASPSRRPAACGRPAAARARAASPGQARPAGEPRGAAGRAWAPRRPACRCVATWRGAPRGRRPSRGSLQPAAAGGSVRGFRSRSRQPRAAVRRGGGRSS
jgi:hypothetical protein